MENKQRWILGGSVAAVLILAFLAGRWTGGANDHVQDPGTAQDDHEHVEAAGDGADETIWTCSMHPQVRQPDPGSCPICGMDLIEVPKDDGPDDESELPRLAVSERAAALMNIRTVPVRREALHAEIRLSGRVVPDERRLARLTAYFPGRVERLYADFTGMVVEKGDPLVTLFSPQLFSAQEELFQAAETGVPGFLEAAREKLQLLGLTADQISEIEERGSPEPHITFFAPFGGTVIERKVTGGDYVQTGNVLLMVSDLSSLWIELDVYETDLYWLRRGQETELQVEAFPGRRIRGEIAFVDPVVNPRTRTARARIDVTNENGNLKPGMFVRGIVHAGVGADHAAHTDAEQSPPLVIPASAPLLTGKRALAYVRLQDTDRPTFEAREIELGPRLGGYYMVLSGLEEGEQVVVQGNFKIDSELQIRGRPSMMAPEGGPPPGHDHGAPVHDHTVGDVREAREAAEFSDAVPASFGDELRPLVQGYLDMVDAMAGDDFSGARDGLDRLHESLLEIGQHRLEGDAHVAWMEHYERLHILSHRIEATQDLEGMRDHLQETTDEVEAIALSFGAGRLGDLQRMYCPMAHDDQGGTWLQDHDTVANPYFGAMMLRCGESLGPLGPGRDD